MELRAAILRLLLATLLLNLPIVNSQVLSCPTSDQGVTDCSRKGLTYVPRDLPSSTKHLRLEGNMIEVIEAADFPTVMAQLEELTLSENLLHDIDTSTFCHKLPKLKILRLNKNKLQTLPDLTFCKSLVEIHSSSNEIVRLDGKVISGLRRLTKLDLSKNNLTRVTAAMIPTNTSLRQLLLNNNDISSMVSGAFAEVPTLERLRLSKNRLSAIPTQLFSDLPNLLALDLSKNRLTTIGHLYFTRLHKVKMINLEKNRINTLLDGSFYKCKALETLNLGYNQLNNIVGGPLFGLDNLTELVLTKNNISSIQEGTWAQASHIKILDISHNKLNAISLTDFTNAGKLASLDLANNKIKQIDQNAFRDLTSLDKLDLSGNELSDIIQSTPTTAFSSLTRLTSLDLRANRLQTITAKLLSDMEQLQTLDLSNNPVTTVDSYAFNALSHLTMLGLSTKTMVCDCKVSWLPEWLQDKRLRSEVDVQCALPTSLRGQNLFDISSSEFMCDADNPIRPVITRGIQPTSALKASNVTLTCIATASTQSPVIVEWRKDGELIPESSGKISTEASSDNDHVSLFTTYLKLVNIDEGDEGHYQCRFKNDFGDVFSTIAQLKVLVFPSFTSVPTSVVVKAGQDAKLLCEATGYPQPFLSWSKDGGRNFPAARDRRFQVNHSKLNEFIIKAVQWQDRGVYYCNATNEAGSIITNATVSVIVPPRFTEDISCTNTKAGAWVLKCQVDSHPNAEIFWYKDGQVIQASEKYVFSVTYNNLFILGATVEDNGLYKCSASNLLGKVTQQCEIKMKESTPEVHVPVTKMEPIKKPTPLDKNTITGLIVIAVVCCVVGTSLVWVVIIYQMRRRQNRNSSTETGEATVPLNGGSKTCTSTQKIGDSISNSSNSSSSSQTKTDSFFEYRGHSPHTFSHSREKYPTMDSELAAAMEPLNPNQDSVDSLALESYTNNEYSRHTVGGIRDCHRIKPSISDYYTSDRQAAHPFSTFQPSRQHRLQNSKQTVSKPAHSSSVEMMPHSERKLPPHLSYVLHQLHAPAQLPHAVVNPVHPHQSPHRSTHHLTNQYEDPGYMNLPQQSVNNVPQSKSMRQLKEPSDYMNVAPKDIHIYQNSSVLSINPQTQTESMESQSIASPEQLFDAASQPSPDNLGNSKDCEGDDQHNTATAAKPQCSSTSNCNGQSADHISRRHRREALADSSFVEKKYGLVFTGDVGDRTRLNDHTERTVQS